MVVSNAFRELAGLLECLERTDVEVRNVAVEEQTVHGGADMAVSLEVGVPVLCDVDFQDGVTVESGGTNLISEKLPVELSVTIPADSSGKGESFVTGDGFSSTSAVSRLPAEVTESNDRAPYKDPDALRAVYEKYDSFPEMTAALGVSVTSETVRRYMVKHGIHQPDNGPQITDDQNAHVEDATHSGVSNGVNADSESIANDEESRGIRRDDGDVGINETPTSDGDTPSGDDDAPTDEGHTSTAESDSPTADDAPGEETDVATDTDGVGDEGNDELADRETEQTVDESVSVAEALAVADSDDDDRSLVADGLGVPKELTIGELATIVNESRTVYEVGKLLGADYDQTRRLLTEFDLIDLVNGRLSAQQYEVTPTDVWKRLDFGEIPT